MQVVVTGGGVTGTMAALAFGDAGHRVTVIERDANPVPATPHEAFTSWNRQGAAHVRHSHAFLARLRKLLIERQPTLLRALFDAGCTELTLSEMLPPTIVDRDVRPGDDELTLLLCRRLTFEWVLRNMVTHHPNVEWRAGAGVAALTGRAHTSVVPIITGVALDDNCTVPADLVVEAGGRRSAILRQLEAIGTRRPDEEIHECGIVYYTRFYEFAEGAEAPIGPPNGDLGYLKFGAFRGDNRTYSITLTTDGDDREMRRVARPQVFDEACRAVPALAKWTDTNCGAPITGVEVMARLRNRRRRFVVDGAPLALGLAVIGDAALCTNPLYGRGCTTGSVHAYLASDAYTEHGCDLDAFAHALHDSTVRDLEPFYRSSVAQDADARANALAMATGVDESPMRAIVRDGLVPAMRTDPVVLRAFMRSFNLLDPPEALLANAEVIAAVMKAYETRAERVPDPPLGPPRAEMIERLSRV